MACCDWEKKGSMGLPRVSFNRAHYPQKCTNAGNMGVCFKVHILPRMLVAICTAETASDGHI